jgi:predicted permease
LGRAFRGEENRSRVVVISHSLWKRKFGGDASIAGRTIGLGDKNYVVIGIAPPSFHGNIRGLATDFWIPLGLYRETVAQLGQGANGPLEQDRNYPWLFVTARLKRGISRAAAQAALAIVETRLDRLYPRVDSKRNLRLVAADALSVAPDQARALLGTLMAVVGLVLLVACANVANLLLARSAARQQEIGVRLAIGAGRRRLVRQLLTESVLLAAIGAVGGIALAWVATGLMGKLQGALPIPAALDFGIDWRVLVFTAGMAGVAAMGFGLVPALKSTRVELTSMLKAAGGGTFAPRRFGWKNGLVVAQVAVSLVLLVVAGLFLRSLKNASSVPLGMNARNVLLLSFDPRAAGYSNQRAENLFGVLLERVRALPEVESAGLADTMPLSLSPNAAGVSRPGANTVLVADIYGVTSQYFRTLGIPLVRGRDFDSGQRPGLPPAAINEALAARLFAGEDAVGKVVAWEGMPHEVIAVAGNAKSRTPTEGPRPQIYVSLEREYGYFWGLYGVVLGVRTAGAPATVIDPVRRRMRELEPSLPVYNVEAIEDHAGRALLVPRLCGNLFGIFGAIALALAAVGLYGVMSYAVRRRTREIGIRMAIGAQPADVLRLLARQGIWLTGIGLGIGLGTAYFVSRILSGFLYGVSARDGATYAGVSLLLLAVATVAVLVPARRAARMDALRSIRYE